MYLERRNVLNLFIAPMSQHQFLETFTSWMKAGVPPGPQHRLKNRLYPRHGAGIAYDGDQFAWHYRGAVLNEHFGESV